MKEIFMPPSPVKPFVSLTLIAALVLTPLTPSHGMMMEYEGDFQGSTVGFTLDTSIKYGPVGDCAFDALGLSRETVIDKLLTEKDKPEMQDLLAPHVEDFFSGAPERLWPQADYHEYLKHQKELASHTESKDRVIGYLNDFLKESNVLKNKSLPGDKLLKKLEKAKKEDTAPKNWVRAHQSLSNNNPFYLEVLKGKMETVKYDQKCLDSIFRSPSLFQAFVTTFKVQGDGKGPQKWVEYLKNTTSLFDAIAKVEGMDIHIWEQSEEKRGWLKEMWALPYGDKSTPYHLLHDGAQSVSFIRGQGGSGYHFRRLRQVMDEKSQFSFSLTPRLKAGEDPSSDTPLWRGMNDCFLGLQSLEAQLQGRIDALGRPIEEIRKSLRISSEKVENLKKLITQKHRNIHNSNRRLTRLQEIDTQKKSNSFKGLKSLETHQKEEEEKRLTLLYRLHRDEEKTLNQQKEQENPLSARLQSLKKSQSSLTQRLGEMKQAEEKTILKRFSPHSEIPLTPGQMFVSDNRDSFSGINTLLIDVILMNGQLKSFSSEDYKLEEGFTLPTPVWPWEKAGTPRLLSKAATQHRAKVRELFTKVKRENEELLKRTTPYLLKTYNQTYQKGQKYLSILLQEWMQLKSCEFNMIIKVLQDGSENNLPIEVRDVAALYAQHVALLKEGMTVNFENIGLQHWLSLHEWQVHANPEKLLQTFGEELQSPLQKLENLIQATQNNLYQLSHVAEPLEAYKILCAQGNALREANKILDEENKKSNCAKEKQLEAKARKEREWENKRYQRKKADLKRESSLIRMGTPEDQKEPPQASDRLAHNMEEWRPKNKKYGAKIKTHVKSLEETHDKYLSFLLNLEQIIFKEGIKKDQALRARRGQVDHCLGVFRRNIGEIKGLEDLLNAYNTVEEEKKITDIIEKSIPLKNKFESYGRRSFPTPEHMYKFNEDLLTLKTKEVNTVSVGLTEGLIRGAGITICAPGALIILAYLLPICVASHTCWYFFPNKKNQKHKNHQEERKNKFLGLVLEDLESYKRQERYFNPESYQRLLEFLNELESKAKEAVWGSVFLRKNNFNQYKEKLTYMNFIRDLHALQTAKEANTEQQGRLAALMEEVEKASPAPLPIPVKSKNETAITSALEDTTLKLLEEESRQALEFTGSLQKLQGLRLAREWDMATLLDESENFDLLAEIVLSQADFALSWGEFFQNNSILFEDSFKSSLPSRGHLLKYIPEIIQARSTIKTQLKELVTKTRWENIERTLKGEFSQVHNSLSSNNQLLSRTLSSIQKSHDVSHELQERSTLAYENYTHYLRGQEERKKALVEAEKNKTFGQKVYSGLPSIEQTTHRVSILALDTSTKVVVCAAIGALVGSLGGPGGTAAGGWAGAKVGALLGASSAIGLPGSSNPWGGSQEVQTTSVLQQIGSIPIGLKPASPSTPDTTPPLGAEASPYEYGWLNFLQRTLEDRKGLKGFGINMAESVARGLADQTGRHLADGLFSSSKERSDETPANSPFKKKKSKKRRDRNKKGE
jgi:hypothetical protein